MTVVLINILLRIVRLPNTIGIVLPSMTLILLDVLLQLAVTLNSLCMLLLVFPLL